MFSQPRGLARRSVPAQPPPGPAASFPGQSHIQPPFTNRTDHTAAVTVTGCHIHTRSHTHLWVFGSVQFGFLTLQGQYRFTLLLYGVPSRGFPPAPVLRPPDPDVVIHPTEIYVSYIIIIIDNNYYNIIM